MLDCFSGSGTTLAVASSLRRRWIGIDNSVEAITTTLHRFAQGTKPMGDFVPKQEAQTTGNVAHIANLWDGLDNSKEVKENTTTPEKAFEPIRDFVLYGTKTYASELADPITTYELELGD